MAAAAAAVGSPVELEVVDEDIGEGDDVEFILPYNYENEESRTIRGNNDKGYKIHVDTRTFPYSKILKKDYALYPGQEFCYISQITIYDSVELVKAGKQGKSISESSELHTHRITIDLNFNDQVTKNKKTLIKLIPNEDIHITALGVKIIKVKRTGMSNSSAHSCLSFKKIIVKQGEYTYIITPFNTKDGISTLRPIPDMNSSYIFSLIEQIQPPVAGAGGGAAAAGSLAGSKRGAKGTLPNSNGYKRTESMGGGKRRTRRKHHKKARRSSRTRR